MNKPPIALEDRDTVDGRMFSPSAGRNKDVIAAHLAAHLPENASVLEIASGTGEHGAAVALARADIRWQYSDPDAGSRASQTAWAAHVGAGLYPPLAIDTSAPDWSRSLPKYDAIFCANMVHIAPIDALLGLAAGAVECVADAGKIWVYGPFLDGADTAESNLAFDVSLKARNPAWGVRELESVKHIFAKHGFSGLTRYEMPKNNLLLAFFR